MPIPCAPVDSVLGQEVQRRLERRTKTSWQIALKTPFGAENGDRELNTIGTNKTAPHDQMNGVRCIRSRHVDAFACNEAGLTDVCRAVQNLIDGFRSNDRTSLNLEGPYLLPAESAMCTSHPVL